MDAYAKRKKSRPDQQGHMPVWMEQKQRNAVLRGMISPVIICDAATGVSAALIIASVATLKALRSAFIAERYDRA